MLNNFKGLTIVSGLILSLCSSGCFNNNDNPVNPNQINGSGKLVSETRIVGTFSGIRVNNFARVFITQDSTESLRIESDDNTIGLVLTSVNNGTLVVGMRDGAYSKVTVNVYASMKSIRLIETIGAAEYSCLNTLKLDSLDCRITGAGTITLSGNTNYENFDITGSAEIHTFNLASSKCIINISGAGNAEVKATRELNAMIAGTGNISYSGNPPVVHQVILGTGTIHPAP